MQAARSLCEKEDIRFFKKHGSNKFPLIQRKRRGGEETRERDSMKENI